MRVSTECAICADCFFFQYKFYGSHRRQRSTSSAQKRPQRPAVQSAALGVLSEHIIKQFSIIIRCYVAQCGVHGALGELASHPRTISAVYRETEHQRHPDKVLIENE